jgi:acyl-CoA synthetase (AMP-forming)/AMP-acid ligase II
VLSFIEALRAADPELAALRFLATDGLPAGTESGWRDPGTGPNSVAFLQYTSGSTAAPKGVVMTYRNLLANQQMIHRVFQQGEDAIGVTWLPLYHDMGLIGHVIHPIYIGATQYLMSPLAFLQRPVRWLQAISRLRVTITGGPNFGYDLAVRRVNQAQRAGLDLSSWRLAFNGAEPIRVETMRQFAASFEGCGFRWDAFSPCYGLAEATLAVTGSPWGASPRLCAVDRAALEAHRVVPDETAGQTLVGCGPAPPYPGLAIVDPETHRRLPPDRVGEIWLTGAHVADGYWGRTEESSQAFAARLADDPEAGPFLRTGDYGFVMGGELYVTGRLKDLIIAGGRNYYPQDLERTAEVAHPSVRAGCVAAFPVTLDGEERVIVLAEVNDPSTEAEAVKLAIRRALVDAHGLAPHGVSLVPPRSLHKTSSGKIQRHACRAAYLAGTLG